MNNNDEDINDMDVIFSYPSENAVKDGVLVSVEQWLPKTQYLDLFSYVTSNLLVKKGYAELKDNDLDVNRVNLLFLLSRAYKLIKDKTNNFHRENECDFFAGEIEFANGSVGKIFIGKNEHDTYTIMLPEDY